MVHYIGVLKPEYYEADVDVIPITYPFAGSHIWWPIARTDSLKLNFDFKSSKPVAVVASGDVKSNRGLGYWEVRPRRLNFMIHHPLKGNLLFWNSNCKYLSSSIFSFVWSTTKSVFN